MERLSQLHHDEIGDIDNIIDRPDTGCIQQILEPCGRIPDFNT